MQNKIFSKFLGFFVMTTLLFSSTVPALAAVPQSMSYTAVLRDAGGTPLSGTNDFKVRYYDASVAGILMYEEEFLATTINGGGTFFLPLGTGSPIAGTFAGINFNSPIFITLNTRVNLAPLYDGEMTPRIPLRSVPFALNSAKLDGRSVGGANGIVAYDASSTINTNGLNASGTINALGNVNIIGTTTATNIFSNLLSSLVGIFNSLFLNNVSTSTAGNTILTRDTVTGEVKQNTLASLLSSAITNVVSFATSTNIFTSDVNGVVATTSLAGLVSNTTASNGLTLLAGDVKLGGVLNQNTNISLATNTLTFDQSNLNSKLKIKGATNYSGGAFASQSLLQLEHFTGGGFSVSSYENSGNPLVDGYGTFLNFSSNLTNPQSDLLGNYIYSDRVSGDIGMGRTGGGLFSLSGGGAEIQGNNIFMNGAAFAANANTIAFSQFANTRDDSASTTALNFLYTDASGLLKSAPVSILGGASSSWSLLGNAGTDPLLNFLGTTDNQPLIFKTNNTQTGKISADGTAIAFGISAGTGASVLDTIFFGPGAGAGASNATRGIFFGRNAGGQATNANDSNFFGFSAGEFSENARNSNFFGLNSGFAATNAADSNFFGSSAGESATNASSSNFFGPNAGFNAQNAAFSNFFGPQAGYGATDANNSNFFGLETGRDAFFANNSNFYGSQAGYGATNAANSNFFGTSAGRDAGSANDANFFGRDAGNGAATAQYANFFGFQAGINAVNAASSNFFGNQAGFNASNAGSSNFFGNSAGYLATQAYSSNFFGQFTGGSATFANNSNFFGTSAGDTAVNAANSNFFGNQAGFESANALNSNFFGERAGYRSSFADNSNFFGSNAGNGAINANNSNFFGRDAGFNAANANNSNFFGLQAGQGASNAVSSNFFGSAAGFGATDAINSNFFGTGAGNIATNAVNSNFFGTGAGNNASKAANSIFIGTSAGDNDVVDNTPGNGDGTSILIGRNTNTGGNSNSIAIGENAVNDRSNQFLVGPAYSEFSFRGVNYTFPGAQANLAGQVLTNDGTGVLTWAAVAAGNNWALTGNGGTSPLTNFIGTTDANRLIFKTNNVNRMNIEDSGGVNVGPLAFANADLQVFGGVKAFPTTFKLANSFTGNAGNAGFDIKLDNVNGNIDMRQYQARDISFSTNNAVRMTLLANGNLGIGTATAGNALTIASSSGAVSGLRLAISSSTAALLVSPANKLLTVDGNGDVVLVDGSAIKSCMPGGSSSNTNECLGTNSLLLNSTGLGNTAIGDSTLNLNTTGSFNTAIGNLALLTNTTADNNTALGYRALRSNTTGTRNNAFGSEALQLNTTGNDNNIIGYRAMFNNTTGIENVALGNVALNVNTTGNYNNAIGNEALAFNTTGSQNSAIGYRTLRFITTGNNNTALGYSTGLGITTGSNNTILGANVSGLAAALSNNIIIADGQGNQRINVSAFGNVGIGTSTPGNALTIASSTGAISGLRLSISSSTIPLATSPSNKLLTVDGNGDVVLVDGGNIKICVPGGVQPTTNECLGTNSLIANTTGGGNTAVGDNTLSANTIGSFGTAIGNQALQSNIGADYNTAIGFQSLRLNTTGFQNTAIGAQTLAANTTGTTNTAIGFRSLFLNTTGFENVGIGNASLLNNTIGSYNNAIGNEALLSNTTGSGNNAIGYRALTQNTTGNANLANGVRALQLNTTGGFNTALGHDSIGNNTTGSNNTGLGYFTLNNNTTGINNTALGYNTGLGIATGSNNTILGANVLGLAAGLSNNIIIADGAGNRRINVDALGNIGIGTTTPSQRLSISGNLRLDGAFMPGNQAGVIGQVLTSQGIGLAPIWTTSSSSPNNSWNILGNTGTDPLVNFIGTTDAQDLVFKTNNAEVARFGQLNNFAFGVGAEAVGNNMNVMGGSAGSGATSAFASNFFGSGAGSGATFVNDSNFFGSQAGINATAATYSNFFGSNSGNGANNAYRSNFSGLNVGIRVTNANNSNFFGEEAGFEATNANNSNFVGSFAGKNATNANFSNFIGLNTGTAATNANNSNFFGTGAGFGATNAANSIFIGENSGVVDAVDNTLGGTSILIGKNTNTGGFSNSIALGASTVNTAANQFVLGSDASAQSSINSLYLGKNSTNAFPLIYASLSGVGIGTTAPAAQLDIQGTGLGASMILGNSGTNLSRIEMRGGRDGGDSSSLYMYNSAGTLSTLISDGSFNNYFNVGVATNFGIGTVTPAEKLQVVGDIRVGTGGSNGCIQNFAGTAIAGTCSSDENLKTNISDLSTSTLDKFSKLRFVTYNWNDIAGDLYKKDKNATNTGVLAQQVQELFPELVSVDSKGYKVVDLTTLFVYSMQAIRDLALKVADFANKIMTKEIITEKLCVGTKDDKTCLNKTEIDEIKNRQNTNSGNTPAPVQGPVQPVIPPADPISPASTTEEIVPPITPPALPASSTPEII